MLTADIINVNTPKNKTSRNWDTLGKLLSISKEIVSIANELIKKPLRENLTLNQIPKKGAYD